MSLLLTLQDVRFFALGNIWDESLKASFNTFPRPKKRLCQSTDYEGMFASYFSSLFETANPNLAQTNILFSIISINVVGLSQTKAILLLFTFNEIRQVDSVGENDFDWKRKCIREQIGYF